MLLSLQRLAVLVNPCKLVLNLSLPHLVIFPLKNIHCYLFKICIFSTLSFVMLSILSFYKQKEEGNHCVALYGGRFLRKTSQVQYNILLNWKLIATHFWSKHNVNKGDDTLNKTMSIYGFRNMKKKHFKFTSWVDFMLDYCFCCCTSNFICIFSV